jgi:hypothetical protein
MCPATSAVSKTEGQPLEMSIWAFTKIRVYIQAVYNSRTVECVDLTCD